MEKIIGERGSGKTTKLLKLAQEKGFVVVEPTYMMANNASDLAKRNRYDVKIINAHEFMWYRPGHRDDKYVVDELDLFLQMIGIEGYSNGPRE